MSDTETISIKPKRHVVPTEPFPEGGDVEVDEDEASVKTSASIYNGNSDSTSLLEEYRGYLEHGRTYQATRNSGFKMPSDMIQYQAMEANHLVHSILNCQAPNSLFLAPIRPNPKHILDLGTGQGQWAVDVSDRFPTAQVFGIDLYPPPQTWIPSNCTLEVDDFTQPWSWPQNQKFDLIHGRYLVGTVSDEEWAKVYREAYEHLAPGGWIERIEVDVQVRCDDKTMAADSLLALMHEGFAASAKDTGNTTNTTETLRGMIESAGFVNVHDKLYKVPIGPWARHPIYKQAGSVNMIAFKVGLEGWVMYLYTKHGKPKPWTKEQVYEYIDKVTKELDQTWHIYQFNRRVWAQKPFEKEESPALNPSLKRKRPSTESWKSTESPRREKNGRPSTSGTEMLTLVNDGGEEEEKSD